MIARMLLVLLLVLNLGVAAWWALHRPVPPAVPTAPDASVPRLALVRASDEVHAVSETMVQAKPASVAEAASPPGMATSKAMVCASFGPYGDEAAAQLARGRMAAPGLQVSIRSVGRANARGYNVYMPPLANRDAALAMIERLRAAGFDDLLLQNDGASANGIALGRFGAEENARRHQAALQAKGFTVQIAAMGGDAATGYWLDVRAPAGFNPSAQRARLGAAQVQRHNCRV